MDKSFGGLLVGIGALVIFVGIVGAIGAFFGYHAGYHDATRYIYRHYVVSAR